MPRSPSPTGSLIGPSRSNSVARQHEKKPYERPSNGNVNSGNHQNPNEQQAGLLGGLKRSLSRWFSASPAPAELESNPTHRVSDSDQRKITTSTSFDSAKRQAPRMSPERAGTPSKKQRVTSPQRFEVQGRAVESFNVREYGSSRLPTQRQDREHVPNYARPFGTAESGSSSMSMTRSRTIGGGYNDPPASLLAGSPGRTSIKPSSSSSGMRRSETMTLRIDREKATPASPASRSFRSPLYTSTSTSTSASGMSRSSTLGNIAAPSGRMSSPFRGQQEAAERVARQRAMREGSSVPASPSRSGLRSQSRMDVEPTSNRMRDPASPTPRAESPRRSMSSMKDMSVVPPSPSRAAVRSSRLRYSMRPMYDDEEDQQEVLMDAPEERDDEMEVSPERQREDSRYRRGTSGRMSVDPVTSPVDQNSQAEMLLQQLAEMRRSSRHVNIQAGLPSSVQAPPTPNSLSTRQMRKRLAVRVPKASSAAEEALRLSTTGSLSEGPARLRGTRRAKELEGEKGKGSVMQRPYARKPSGYSRPKSEETDEAQDKEEPTASDEEQDNREAATEKPFTFSMANAPTKISGPMNITFSPSATKIVRTGTGSNLRAQSAVTRRTHEPAAGASRKTESTRSNQFAIPDDDDDDDDEMEDDVDDFPASRSRQPSQSPQPVSIPAPVRSPSPRKKKDVDVTAVRKVRGFLDAAGVNRPRASSPLAAAPLNASALTKTAPMQLKPSLNLGSSSASSPVPDFFAMPKKPVESAAPTAGKGMSGIGLGRPGASTPAPSIAFTAPSPTSSPTVNAVGAEPVKPAPAFSFEPPASTTPAKLPPFVFSAPAAATNNAKMPDFFAKPGAASAEPKAAVAAPAAAASPSFFGNPASAATPAQPASGGFNFSAPKPLSLFGSSSVAPAAGSASSPSAPAASLPATQDKPADKAATAPSFTFGASQPSAPAPSSTGGLFGSNKPAEASTNPLFGGAKSTAAAAAAAAPATTPTPFAFGGTSTKPSSSSTFGSGSDVTTPAPSSPFAFGSSAPQEQAKAPAPTNLFGPSSTASTTPAAAPPSNLFGAAASKPSTPSAAPGGFDFGTTPSATTPTPAFSFGSTETKSSPSPAPFSFGSNTPTSTPFGAAAASPAPSNNMFGGAAPASGGMFGSTSNGPASGGSAPSFGGFGQTAPASPFGQPAAAAPAPATGFGGFGAPSQSAAPAPGGMFGATSSGFGASPAPQPGMFGSAPGTPGTPGTANTGFSFNVGGSGPAFPAGDSSRQPSPAFSVGAGDAPGGRKIRKLPTTRKK